MPSNDVESSEEEDDDFGGYSTPPEYEPCPPRHRQRLEEDYPEYDPVADHQVPHVHTLVVLWLIITLCLYRTMTNPRCIPRRNVVEHLV